MAYEFTPGMPNSDSPGPWTVDETDTRVVVMDVCGGFVAECTDGHDSDDGYIMAAKSAQIARLIAAAPELLAALQEMLPRFEPLRIRALSAKARAAIAKATGSST